MCSSNRTFCISCQNNLKAGSAFTCTSCKTLENVVSQRYAWNTDTHIDVPYVRDIFVLNHLALKKYWHQITSLQQSCIGHLLWNIITWMDLGGQTQLEWNTKMSSISGCLSHILMKPAANISPSHYDEIASYCFSSGRLCILQLGGMTHQTCRAWIALIYCNIKAMHLQKTQLLSNSAASRWHWCYHLVAAGGVEPWHVWAQNLAGEMNREIWREAIKHKCDHWGKKIWWGCSLIIGHFRFFFLHLAIDPVCPQTSPPSTSQKTVYTWGNMWMNQLMLIELECWASVCWHLSALAFVSKCIPTTVLSNYHRNCFLALYSRQ